MTIINVCNLFAPIDWNNKYSYSYYILSETPAVVYQYEKNVSKFSSDLTQLHWSCIFIYIFFFFFFFIIAENWLHVSGEPSHWQITQANKIYYTSLKDIQLLLIFAFYYARVKTTIECAQIPTLVTKFHKIF